MGNVVVLIMARYQYIGINIRFWKYDMGFPALLILDFNLVSNQTMLQHYHLDVSALFTYVVRFPISCMNVRKKFTDARIQNNLSISKALITSSVEHDILQDFCKKYLRGRRARIYLKKLPK